MCYCYVHGWSMRLKNVGFNLVNNRGGNMEVIIKFPFKISQLYKLRHIRNSRCSRFFFFKVGMLPRVGDFQQEDTAGLACQCASFSSLRNRRSTCVLICFLKIGYSGLRDQQGHVILTEGRGLCSKEKQLEWLEKPVQGWRAGYIQRGVLCFPADVS